MTSTNKHTATLSIRTAKAGKSAITNEQYYDHILEPLNVLIERSTSETSANAEFIVRACNSHEKMLSALWYAREIILNEYPSGEDREAMLKPIDEAIENAEVKP